MAEGKRRVKHWLDRLARSRHDLTLIATISFMEAIIVPIPLELVLIPYMLKDRQRAWAIAAAALAGCLVAALIGYFVGLALFESVGRWLLEVLQYTEQYQTFQDRFEQNGFWAIILVGVVPIPFQVAMLVAGSAGYSLPLFMLASAIARGIRYFGLALLVELVGDQALALWNRHSRLVGGALLIVALVAFYFMLR
ncbi:YqaA family protein [Hydrocarboniclastica marina]|uniref:DedA family protein n=1 Tax=Hydrocarboniclastica marina TaxID=2259620 RepID=A0A4P7XCQ2_9ALTE|nr:VTT domain-containing protein [Hydrocarboniclastica marina]QCF24628.1 DedA family protein [Hydrocarboniclastica marina]